MELLEQEIRKAPIARFGDYEYFISPISDGIPHITPELLEEVTGEIIQIGDLNCDKIVTIEAMGIHLATALSLRTRLPFNVIRKRKYGLEGEIEFQQRTGYSKQAMYVNGLEKGDRVVMIDDVISTGGTLRGIIPVLKNAGVEIVDIIIVINKGNGKAEIEEEFGINIKTLVDVNIINGRIEVMGSRN